MNKPVNPPVEPPADGSAGAPGWLSRHLRSSEAWFLVLAVLIGAAAGASTALLSTLAHGLQRLLFGLPADNWLSAQRALDWPHLLVMPLGGIVLAVFTWLVRARGRALVDAVEANALHGGRMSLRDSLIICGQTLISNGFGASVGLEAAYAQMGGGIASAVGRRFGLRRPDLRTLVGAAAGAGVGAAFGAPLAGAFYAFEIVLGAYTPFTIAPVAAAALTAGLVAQALGETPYILPVITTAPIGAAQYGLYSLLGAACAGIGIVLMQAITTMEALTKRARLPDWARPAVGGLLLVPLAALSPQVLSAGHGALYLDVAATAPFATLVIVFLAKCAASAVSLGFGFRGGLFFASLLLGSLIGHIAAEGASLAGANALLDPSHAAIVGMAALSVAVIGGPLTMAMLVLQVTENVALTGVVIAAALTSSTIVRVMFGYSFSTWRLHLRGETIRSARDVGWVKTLTAGAMMRRGTNMLPATLTIAEFRKRVPLGAASRVVLVDEEEHYFGMVEAASAYAADADAESRIGTLAVSRNTTLRPGMDIVAVMRIFDETQRDELAVVDAAGFVLGILTEAFVRKRYAEELEKAQMDLFGERKES